MSLDSDYRPRNLNEVYGNKALKSSLGTILKKPKKVIPHVYLFTGPKGCGKTSLGRIVANHLKCNPFEFQEIDAAVYGKVEEARELAKNVHYPPMKGDVRIWFMDEAHRLTDKSQEALLKTLEEPPEHAFFIFSTTDPQKLIKTFKDRCTIFEVKPLSDDEMLEMLEEVVEGEEKKVPADVLKRIVNDAQGHPRAALKQLERVIDLPSKEMLAAAEQSAESEAQIIDLCRALLDPKSKWESIAKIISTLSTEPETSRYAILGYCNQVLLKSDNPRAWLIIDCFSENTYNTGKVGITKAAYSVVCG